MNSISENMNNNNVSTHNNEERLLSFRLVWQDAWHYIDDGIDTDFYHSAEGVAKIDFLVEMEHFTINLDGREQRFINEIRDLNVQNIDNQCFHDDWALDGYHWFFRIKTSAMDVCSSGWNAYPQEFVDLLIYLHSRYKIPYPHIFKYAKKGVFPREHQSKKIMSVEERSGIGPRSYIRE